MDGRFVRHPFNPTFGFVIPTLEPRQIPCRIEPKRADRYPYGDFVSTYSTLVPTHNQRSTATHQVDPARN